MHFSKKKVKYSPMTFWATLVLLAIGWSFPDFITSRAEIRFFCSVSPAVHASSTIPESPEPGWSVGKTDLQPDPALRFGRLQNGIRYVLLANSEPKNRVSVHLDVQAGSMNEQDQEQGLAHFLEHMLFCGSTHFKPGELVKYFQSIGMQFGPDANGRTGFSETVYDIVLPKGDTEYLDNALLVMADYAGGALLLPEEIKRESKVVLAEMHSRDSASYRTFESTFKFEFSGAKIAGRLPIGKENILKTIDRPVLKAFYDAWYRPDNMILIMVGDFDVQTAESLIKKRFGDFSARAPKPPEPNFGKIQHKGVSAFYRFDRETGNTTVSIEVIQQLDPQVDSFDLRKRLLLQTMADRIIQYRLNDRLASPNTPFTSASIHSGIFLNRILYAEITAECDPDNWEKTLCLIEQTLRQALLHGFTKAELERIKVEILSELDNAVKNASTRNSNDLAGDIISHLNQNRVFMSPLQEKDLFSPVVMNLKTNDLHEAIKTAWPPDHRLVLITGSAQISDKKVSPEAGILHIYGNSRAVPVSLPEEKKRLAFPYLPIPLREGKILNRSTIPDLGVAQIEFENQMRLNLKKTNFNANEVFLQVSFGRGKSAQPADKAGLSDLSRDVVKESGLGALDREDLEAALAGKQTEFSFEIEEDRFLLKTKTVSKEVETAFQLLSAHILDPAFGKEAFDLVMKRFNQEYDGLNHSIEGAMTLQGQRFLAGGDSRFGLPSQETFNRLSLQDVKAWITPALQKSPLEISVVGDFDMESVISLASRYFGTLQKREAVEKKVRPLSPGFPSGKMLNLPVDTKIPKAMVVVSYATDDIWDIVQTRKLSVLAEIFSERLRKQIREKLGETYSPQAYHHPSRAYKGYGALHAIVQTDPSSAGQVGQEIQRISHDLAVSGITPEELQLAVHPLLTGIRDLIRKNDYWLNTVLTGSKDHPEQLDWSRSILSGYSSITREEVSELAGRYLKNPKAAVIVIVPENESGKRKIK